MFCFATGNTARMRGLDCGFVEVGRAADFVFMDRAPQGAGRVRCGRSRNTPTATEIPVVVTPGQ